MTYDRVGGPDMAYTGVLAVMLGVRRPTVTLVMQNLQTAGLVDHARRAIDVVDRAGLEATSCECYATIATFERLLPEISAAG